MANRVVFHRGEMEALLRSPSGDVARDLVQRGRRVVNRAKELAPVDTGRLRSSITASPLTLDGRELTVFVGTNVEYACVYGAKNAVTTERGSVHISRVRPGDRVLTASGEWRDVVKVSKFPVYGKPDLVTLTARWRADRPHRLTVTDDHEVAVQREDGRVTWLPAAAIIPGSDKVFQRRKVTHNAGMNSAPVRRCRWCGRAYQGQGRTYCSVPCRDKAWAAGANPHVGMKRTVEQRERMSASMRDRGVVNHLAAWRRHNGGTSIERDVMGWLDGRGVAYRHNWPVGDLFVDFWLPEHGEVVEADGAYWHRDQTRDIARDRRIRETLPGARILHLHFFDPRWTPILNPEPLPGVRYEIVNPTAEHFVDPDTFEAVPVEVEHWTWRRPADKASGNVTMLYDLTVEGVHSFLAQGLLISNSYVELGTSRMAGRHFLERALEAARQ